jgi:chitin synthase
MIFSLTVFKVKHLIFPEKMVTPNAPEAMAYVIPCYNETEVELTRSLDSLVNQTDLDGHQRAVIIIVDGRVKGPGMDKTTADSLFDDILLVRHSRRIIKNAYITWSHEYMDIEVQVGTYKSLPYYCIAKQRNQGKRDSLVCIRSFLYHYNIRTEQTPGIFSQDLFADMVGFLSRDAGIEKVDVLVGMDADTVFDDACVTNLLKESRYPKTVG